jgi:hypothetical protein
MLEVVLELIFEVFVSAISERRWRIVLGMVLSVVLAIALGLNGHDVLAVTLGVLGFVLSVAWGVYTNPENR